MQNHRSTYIQEGKLPEKKKNKIRHCKGAFVEAIWRALLQPREVQKAEETLVRGCAKLKMKKFLSLKNDLLERKIL